MFKESINAVGICHATHIAKDEKGNSISLYEALSEETKNFLKDRGLKIPSRRTVKGNLVVNTGRSKLAHLLGKHKSGSAFPTETAFIDRLVLGDCKVSGQTNKAACLPQLSDTGLQSEISTLGGVLNGKFSFDHTPDQEVFYPASTARHPAADGWSPTLADITLSGGDYILTDASQDFTGVGLNIQITDQVKVNTPSSSPVLLGVKEIVSATQLKVHNPNGYTGLSVQYRIDTPGTQVLFSKLINGNSFDQATWGFATLVHEAGLLFNDGTLFNRVVFRPDDDELGLILQSNEANGSEISVRFEWLVTF